MSILIAACAGATTRPRRLRFGKPSRPLEHPGFPRNSFRQYRQKLGAGRVCGHVAPFLNALILPDMVRQIEVAHPHVRKNARLFFLLHFQLELGVARIGFDLGEKGPDFFTWPFDILKEVKFGARQKTCDPLPWIVGERSCKNLVICHISHRKCGRAGIKQLKHGGANSVRFAQRFVRCCGPV